MNNETKKIHPSEDAYRSYFQDLEFLPIEDKIVFKELDTTYRVKHGVELKIRNIFYDNRSNNEKNNSFENDVVETKKNKESKVVGSSIDKSNVIESKNINLLKFGNAADPEHKRYFKVVSSEHSKLLNHFYNSKQLLVIGIINIEVLEALKSIDPEKTKWEEIYVLFPKDDNFKNIPQPIEIENKDLYISQKKSNKKDFASFTKTSSGGGKIDIEVGEYEFLPTVGIIAGDYKTDEGRLQINYYLWGDVVTLKPTLWSMTVILDKKEDKENYEKFEKYVDFVLTKSSFDPDLVAFLISGGKNI